MSDQIGASVSHPCDPPTLDNLLVMLNEIKAAHGGEIIVNLWDCEISECAYAITKLEVSTVDDSNYNTQDNPPVPPHVIIR